MTRTTRYATPRPLSDWTEDGHVVAGHEVGGLALPPYGLAALAIARATGQPCELVVIGEEWHDDGRHHLVLGASRAHIEAVTDYRDDGAGHLHYVCSECGSRGGRHVRGCAA